MDPTVTTVVMTRDRLPDLSRTLPRHRGPVVVVDNGSTDGTPQHIARAHPDVRVVALGRNAGAEARNVGVRLAETPYVAFADDDSWWEPGALELAAELFDRHPRLAVLAGRVLLPDGREDPVCAEMAAAPLGRDDDLPGPNVLGFLACGAVVRRTAYLEVGGFDPVLFFGGEEERVALDLLTRGWGMAYCPEVVARHEPSPRRESSERAVRWRRNELLTALMRRPWPVVARAAAEAARSGREGRLGLLEAARRAGPALARRHVVPPHVEAARRSVER